MSPPDRLVTRFPNYFSRSLFCECDIRFAAYYLPYISRFEADESKSDVTDIAMLMKLYYIIIMVTFLGKNQSAKSQVHTIVRVLAKYRPPPISMIFYLKTNLSPK